MQIIDDITSILNQDGSQMITDALTLLGSNPNVANLQSQVNFGMPLDTRGHTHKVRVSGNDSAGTFAVGGAYNRPGRDEFETFNEQFSRYHFVIETNKSDLARIEKSSDTKIQIANFIDTQIMGGRQAVFDTIENDLFAGDKTTNINGFNGLSVVRSTTNTYGTINASAFTNTGAAQVLDLSGSLTIAAMDTVDAQLTDGVGGQWDVIYCSKNTQRIYQRLNPTTNSGVPQQFSTTATDLTGRVREFSAGFVNTFYNGRPVIPIQGYPDGIMDFLSRDMLMGSVLRPWTIESYINDELVRWVATWEGQFWFMNRRKGFASIINLTA